MHDRKVGPVAYKLGVVVGPLETHWSALGGDVGSADDTDDLRETILLGGVVDSVVGVLDGEMVAGSMVASAPNVQHATSDFVSRLGDAEPLMIGGTPYGVESLLGHLISSVVSDARSQLGSDPTTVVLVHDDGLDDYHLGLWTEAGRLAGVPVANLLLIPKAVALPAQSGSDPLGPQLANGAASAGWRLRPDSPITGAAGAAGGIGGGTAGIVAGTAAAVAGGAVLGVTALGGEAIAAAPSVAAGLGVAGPAGSPLSPVSGPAGSPLSAPAGPTGTPISTPAGPTGTPISTPAGPTGTPISTPAGPTGTPISTPAGPTGTPISRIAKRAAIETGKRSYKVPIIAGVVAAVGLVAGISVLAGNNDGALSTAATTVAVAAGDDVAAPTLPGEAGDADAASTDAPSSTEPQSATSPPTTESAGAAAITCTQGSWTMANEWFSALWLDAVAADGGGATLESVNGTVTVDVGADGIWTSTYTDWGFTAIADDGSVTITMTIAGSDVTAGTFADDGTMTFVDTDVNSVVTMTVIADGMELPIPTPSAPRSAFAGSGSFVCEGDTLTLNIDGNPGPIVMNRTS